MTDTIDSYVIDEDSDTLVTEHYTKSTLYRSVVESTGMYKYLFGAYPTNIEIGAAWKLTQFTTGIVQAMLKERGVTSEIASDTRSGKRLRLWCGVPRLAETT